MRNALAGQLKQLRKRKGLTQKEVADALAIGQTAVANYENGSRLPDLGMCVQIADFYRVSLDRLVGRTPAVTAPGPAGRLPHTAAAYFAALNGGDKPLAQEMMRDCLRAGVPSERIYFDLLEPALVETGRHWVRGDLPVWKEHLISEVVLENLTMIQRNRQRAVHPNPKTILSILPGAEQHGIGLRMISAMLEERGHNALYLGNHLPADHVLEAAVSLRAEFVLFSVTMEENVDTATLLIDKIRRSLGKKSPVLIIGGQAFDKYKDPAAHTGADRYCRKYADLLRIVK